MDGKKGYVVVVVVVDGRDLTVVVQ